MVKTYFIQYKFITPKNTKFPSYSYQKLFRSIYGYTQNITKSSGKVYKYYRTGVLSYYPYIKQGKNAVTIPTQALNPLINFFKTGKNPAHRWREKGDWNALYYLSEKNIKPEDLVNYVENHLKNHQINFNENIFRLEELLNKDLSKDLNSIVLEDLSKLTLNNWFDSTYSLSSFLQRVKSMVLRK